MLRPYSFATTIALIATLAACQPAEQTAADTDPSASESTIQEATPLPEGMPNVGEAAPAFTLVSNEGNEVNLADYLGHWVVLYFYPKDFTSGCTLQARNFQRDLSMYEERDAFILGVSVDDVQSHEDFCAKEGLSFKLLADTDAAISEAYGSVNEGGSRRQSRRNTFVIDPDGNVAKVYVGVDPSPHSQEVLADLDRLQDA